MQPQPVKAGRQMRCVRGHYRSQQSIFSCRRYNTCHSCIVRSVCRSRPDPCLCGMGSCLALGEKPVVSRRTSNRNRYRGVTILVRCHLPAYDLGNEFARTRRNNYLRGFFCNSLAKPASLFSGTALGLRRLLHCFWRAGVIQLVPGPAKFVFSRG